MLGETAKRAFIAAIVVGAVVVGALALWQLRVLVALLFLAVILAAAMRSGIERLAPAACPAAPGSHSTTSS